MTDRPKRKQDWVGRRVVSQRSLLNGMGELPAGTIYTVRRNHGGLHLISDRCPKCGARQTISNVPEAWVDLLPKEPG